MMSLFVRFYKVVICATFLPVICGCEQNISGHALIKHSFLNAASENQEKSDLSVARISSLSDTTDTYDFYEIVDCVTGEKHIYISNDRESYDLLRPSLKFFDSVDPFVFDDSRIAVVFSTRAGYLHLGVAVFDLSVASIDKARVPEVFFVSNIDLVYFRNLKCRVEITRDGKNAAFYVDEKGKYPLIEFDATKSSNPYGTITYRISGRKGIGAESGLVTGRSVGRKGSEPHQPNIP